MHRLPVISAAIPLLLLACGQAEPLAAEHSQSADTHGATALAEQSEDLLKAADAFARSFSARGGYSAAKPLGILIRNLPPPTEMLSVWRATGIPAVSGLDPLAAWVLNVKTIDRDHDGNLRLLAGDEDKSCETLVTCSLTAAGDDWLAEDWSVGYGYLR